MDPYFGLVSPGRRPPIPGGGPQTVAAVLDAGLRVAPDRVALVCRHHRLTFAQLSDDVARASGWLRSIGVKPGDRVACSMGNYSELVITFLATMRLGAIWVGLNRTLAPPECAYILANSGVSIFVGDRQRAELVRAQMGDLADLRHVVDAEPGDAESEWARSLQAADPLTADPVIDPFAPAAIAYTSGTTGRPKGAVHSQHNLLLPGAVTAAQRPDPDARLGVLLPLTILNLVVLAPLVAFQDARICVLIDRPDPVGIAQWVRNERVTTFATVPTILHDLLTHPDVTDEDLASLVRPQTGGAGCPESFKRMYLQRFGTRVTVGYGLTEAPTAVTVEDPALPAVEGAAGRSIVQVSVTIRDDQGAVVPAGTAGEVCVGPAAEGPFAGVYTPMLGYWQLPDATTEALRDGILYTGDLGWMNQDGDLFITDRKNDLIIRGGSNVSPAEVERVIQDDDRVAACAVLGVADERLGERVVAVIVRASGAEISAEEIAQRCRSELSRYKVPQQFIFVDDLPRNAMAKVVKRELRARLGL